MLRQQTLSGVSDCSIADEDFCGQNVLLLTSFLLHELLKYPRERECHFSLMMMYAV